MIKMLAHNVFISNMLTLPGLAASYRQRWHRLSLICTQGKLSGEDTHLLMKPSSCYFLFLSSCFTCSPPSSGTGERAREKRSTKWSNKKTRLAGEVQIPMPVWWTRQTYAIPGPRESMPSSGLCTHTCTYSCLYPHAHTHKISVV